LRGVTLLKIIELIHDYDHPDIPSNVNIWAEKRGNIVIQRHYAYKDTVYPELDTFDLLIIHGGSQHLWNKETDPWLTQEIDFVKKAVSKNIPVIGFCLGSQIIAEAFNGRVFQNEKKETGFFPIIPYPEFLKHPLLKGLEKGFSTFEWHGDHYSLPEGFQTLAYTETAKNQIIVSKSVPAVGFQFHPEYTNKIISTYTVLNDQEQWHLEEGAVCMNEFIQAVSLREETYELFQKLMENTLNYFRNIFHFEKF
jgi:GMP synthase-like glutamine amidotransferase